MEAVLSGDTIVVASKKQVSCNLGDEAAVLNLQNSVYYGLNPVGARIWSLLQQPRRVNEIRDTIANEYDVRPDRCQSDLLALLRQLLNEGLVQLQGEVVR